MTKRIAATGAGIPMTAFAADSSDPIIIATHNWSSQGTGQAKLRDQSV